MFKRIPLIILSPFLLSILSIIYLRKSYPYSIYLFYYLFSRRPLSDAAKLVDYLKSHNRLHLYIDNHIWDSAISAVRSVPIPSVFPETVKVISTYLY